MRRYTPAARIWIVTMTALASVVSALVARYQHAAPRDWLTLGVLGVCAAIAHFFPIRSTSNEASFRLTNVFIIAGAIILPVSLLTPLAIIALAPESWRDRRRTAGIVRWMFNTAQVALAANVTGLWVHAFRLHHVAHIADLAVMAGGAVCFIVVQNLIVGGAMALHFRTALWHADVLQGTALITDGMYGLLGMTVAGMWFATPMLLLLLVPAFLLAHNLTRTAHLAALAQHDPKTGLRNSRSFEHALEKALGRTRRTGAPVSLLFADLDHFKRVNDRYGHAAGDLVLQHVARLMRATLRHGDILSRFGGEEFVALLADTDADAARLLAERVCAAIAEHDFILDDGKIVHCTVSIGVATAPHDGTEVKALLTRADWAMYQAKTPRNSAWHETAPPLALPSTHGLREWPIRRVRLVPGWIAVGCVAAIVCGALMSARVANSEVFLVPAHRELGAAVFAVTVIVMGFTLAYGARRSQQTIEALELAKTKTESAYRANSETLHRVIETVASVIDTRDNLVWGHSRNVAEYSVLIGEELHLPPEALAHVRTAGLLHDLGKIGIPEAILHKPGRLTADEYALVKQHPETGKRILAEADLLSEVARMVGDHHERFDGTGYPQGIAGSAISIGGRILAVADALDSILSDRVYAHARPLAEALEEIDRYAGTQFDPAVVVALHRVVAAHGAGLFKDAPHVSSGARTDGEPAHILTFPAGRTSTVQAQIETGA